MVDDELEKKFHVDELPFDIPVNVEEMGYNTVKNTDMHYLITQNYFYIGDKEEVRIREVNDGDEVKHFITSKEGILPSRREEYNIINSDIGKLIMKGFREEPIRKMRFLISMDNVTAEVDVYLNKKLLGLVLVEVEFDTLSQMDSFVAPDWFGEEINYTNGDLWKIINYIGVDIDEN